MKQRRGRCEHVYVYGAKVAGTIQATGRFAGPVDLCAKCYEKHLHPVPMP